jgi:hypothetical protein
VNSPQDTFLQKFQSENQSAGICGVLSSGQSPIWAWYQVAWFGGNEDIPSGVFLLVRPQLCHVPPSLYVRRVFMSDFFTLKREAAGPPKHVAT